MRPYVHTSARTDTWCNSHGFVAVAIWEINGARKSQEVFSGYFYIDRNLLEFQMKVNMEYRTLDSQPVDIKSDEMSWQNFTKRNTAGKYQEKIIFSWKYIFADFRWNLVETAR